MLFLPGEDSDRPARITIAQAWPAVEKIPEFAGPLRERPQWQEPQDLVDANQGGFGHRGYGWAEIRVGLTMLTKWNRQAAPTPPFGASSAPEAMRSPSPELSAKPSMIGESPWVPLLAD
jgi:hypothetical protein